MKEQISNWISLLCKEETPDSDIVALNFGLFESPAGFSLYLIGSHEYDAEDDDWACYVDYEPKRKYLEINNLGNSNIESNSFLQVVVEIISDLMQKTEISESTLFHNRIITIGFDDGELIRIK